jgi:hypothetical protein
MEDTVLWDAMDDYSSFLPGADLDLFGDSAFDFNFTSLPSADLDIPADWTQDDSNTQVFQSYDTIHTTYPDLDNDCDAFPVTNSRVLLPVSEETTKLAKRHTSKTHTHTNNHRSPSSSPIEEVSSSKRKMEESMIVFAAHPNVKVAPKRRKAFSKTRKQEVAMNRLIGACIQCKLRKGRVSAHYSYSKSLCRRQALC